MPDKNSSKSSILQRTEGTEGFYRHAWGGGGTSSTNNNADEGGIVSVESMERSDARAPQHGTLMAPGDLGRQVSSQEFASASSNQKPTAKIMAHPATIRAHKRTMNAIRRAQQNRTLSTLQKHSESSESWVSKLTAFTYRGMEVTFATTDKTCYGLCSRTRFVFQTLDLVSPAPILSLVSHPITGQVVMAHNDGTIQTYIPEPTDPTETSFGRFRWWNGPTMNCRELFYSQDEAETFKEVTDKPGERLEVSLSHTFRILVAHQSQLLVLDATPYYFGSGTASQGERRVTADLLWNTRLPGTVVTAKISGDGEAIALVLDRNADDDDGGSDGVHTFERDLDDGTSPTASSSSRRRSPVSPVSMARARSAGIVYRPGPFLVHGAPVSRLSFRGYGHTTSNVRSTEQGCDLLLTYCGSTYAAKIFNQNAWRPLTEWVTPPQTRVDWIRGVSAFTLGDLESQKKPKTSSSAPASRRPSLGSSAEAEAINEALGSRRSHYSSIPSHTTPSSNAGAWLAEITFYGQAPTIRLSRLTYLKRGMDELNPTLFENVSSFAPPGFLWEEPLLRMDDTVLSVEGIWPAWNPWLAGTVETDVTETLRGSAMAFLGLSSGPGLSGGGHFGDSLLGSTQSPPSELRMTASHFLPGKVVSLEFSVLGDEDWSALELGNPRRAIMVLTALDSDMTKNHDCASTEYDASRLVAQIGESQRDVAVSWHKQGALTLLPMNWLPEDAPSTKTVKLLEEKRWFKDDGLTSVPLALPSVCLPSSEVSPSEEILAIAWWPEDHFAAPPILVALTSKGSVILFELPPPWSSQEPMTLRTEKPADGQAVDEVVVPDNDVVVEQTYEVSITPHPEFGLGLRLEVQRDGSTAVAGSFKRHPLNGDILPAEKTGMVVLGDELVSANGVPLEDKPFDEIIGTVRDLGVACGPGSPMRLKFRRKDAISADPSSRHDHSPGRRTFEDIIGIRSSHDKGEPQSVDMDTPEKKMSQPTKVFKDFGSVIAVFKDACPLVAIPNSRPQHRAHLSLTPFVAQSRLDASRSALLCYVSGTMLCTLVIQLNLTSLGSGRNRVRATGVWDATEHIEGERADLAAFDVVKSDENSFNVVVCDCRGRFGFVSTSIEKSSPSATPNIVYRYCDMFHSPGLTLLKPTLRVAGVDLVGLLVCNEDGVGDEISVWTPYPHPGCPPGAGGSEDFRRQETASSASEYIRCLLRASHGDSFIDFSFLHSGFLDSTAALLAFSEKHATMFTRPSGGPDWLATIQISHVRLPSSSVPSFDLQQGSWRSSLAENLRVVPAMLHAYSSPDEKGYLCSDWHPEAVLAYLYSDATGTNHALGSGLRRLFLWLWFKGRDVLEDGVEASLLVAPLALLDVSNDGSRRRSSSRDVFGNGHALHQSEEDKALRNLSTMITARCKHLDKSWSASTSTPLQGSASDLDVPTALMTLGPDDLHTMRAFCDVLLDAPDLENIDSCAQHFRMSVAIGRKLRSSDDQAPAPTKAISGFTPPRFLVKTSSTATAASDCSEETSTIPSTAALAGLLSNCQSSLVESCKQLDRKLDWSLARELRLAFWVRSDLTLARLAEEIGQTIFREKRDVMECALFFIVARKIRTLRNLAATDLSDTGKKFFKFLTSHDFSSERGRRAAEKNAFSLLRKCRYQVSAAFFLLAEPPALNSALETIVTKTRDLDLAFLVARLVESRELASTSVSGIAGFGSVMGGGGGYASVGTQESQPMMADDSKFDDWNPSVGKGTTKLLVTRTMPMSSQDPGLTALQLLWLGKQHEASWCLTGIVRAFGNEASFRVGAELGSSVLRVDSARVDRLSPVSRATAKVNAITDFVSSPFLLKAMRSSSRARFASALVVAQSLSAKGVEMSAIQTILSYSDPFEPEEKENVEASPNFSQSDVEGTRTAKPLPATSQTSIFDAYDVYGQVKSSNAGSVPTIAAEASKSTQPSIFDAFDVPRKVPAAAPEASSIFDAFEVPVPKKPPQTSDAVSSIFDSYEVPPEARKPSDFLPSQVHLKIFDSYDAGPPRISGPWTSESATSGMTEASMIDSSVNEHQANGSVPNYNSSKQADEPEEVDMTPIEAHEHTLEISRMPTPRVWVEWRRSILVRAAARRLVREIGTVLAQFHGDPVDPPISEFFMNEDPLVPSGASGILQLPCDAEFILGKVLRAVQDVSRQSTVEQGCMIEEALRLLGPSHQQHRTLFAVVLHCAVGKVEVAEDILRSAAFDLTYLCKCFAFSFDHLVHKRETKYQTSSQFLRRRAARVSWQIETCLWLHRGGGLPLSGAALKEAITAVRLGLLIASWNHNQECLEAMIRSEPDCQIDEEAGGQLWMSLKVVGSNVTAKRGDAKKVSSGGWEFLVDCRRSEATQMLRDKRTGCFIIRPHSGDHGVFTLSFKTNLVPSAGSASRDVGGPTPDTSGDELSDTEIASRETARRAKPIKQDDVVQHAIIRLSETGYRCGSFGPYTTLISLLEAVSDSLPFKLRFDLPPSNRVIKEEGSQSSPNAVFLRKLALSHADSILSGSTHRDAHATKPELSPHSSPEVPKDRLLLGKLLERQANFGLFLELLIVSAIRRQLSGVVAANYDDYADSEGSDLEDIDCLTDDSSAPSSGVPGIVLPAQDGLANAFRTLAPLSAWCRSLEIRAALDLSPFLEDLVENFASLNTADLDDSTRSTEGAPPTGVTGIDAGDAILRKMIQRDSGIEFSTLRLVDGGECTIVVIFSQKDAIQWLVQRGVEETETNSLGRLNRMEKARVIEAVDLSRLKLKQKDHEHWDEGVRYRILDPWEVEALHNWEAETLGASLGRERFLGFHLGKVGLASETVFRALGGLPLLELWTCTKGGVVLTKALATVHPPWERGAGGDMQFRNGAVSEPTPFVNSIRQHLYRNALFRRLQMPQRFVALIQVELLDLKNLTAPGGSLSMSVYALLRLKRDGSNAALTNKARTLDTASTHPVKLGKSSGPNAPASWGSVVRFRFPLPEQATVDGVSVDNNRELLFKGPPRVLQVSVYEKKLLVDYALGTADIRMDGLWAGGQLEEWVPLRSDKHGISWFARIRLTLRFELMCLSSGGGGGGGGGAVMSSSVDLDAAAPSVGLRKIKALCQAGGSAQEDMKRSASSPDLLTYFENMVY